MGCLNDSPSSVCKELGSDLSTVWNRGDEYLFDDEWVGHIDYNKHWKKHRKCDIEGA